MTFCVSLCVFLILGGGMLRGEAEARRASAEHVGGSYAQRVSHRLQEVMGAAYMMGSLVQQGRGKVNDFETAAASILQLFPMASSVQLAPNGVITQVFPLPGNEIIVGSDLFRASDRRLDAHKAMTRRQLVVSGPYKLLQGGMGAIGRLPIYLPDANGWSKFWGFAIVVVRIPALMEAVAIDNLREEGYRYELCRETDEGGCEFFFGSGERLSADAIEFGVEVQNGRWRLRLQPESGWYPVERWLLLAAVGLLLAVFVTFAQYMLLRRLGR